MKRHLPGLLACLLLAAHAQAAPPHWCGQAQAHPLDAAYARALQRTGGVTVDIRNAQGTAWQGWDAELNRLYRQALRALGAGERSAALRKAQRAWLAWDGAEAASDQAMQADAGTLGPVVVADLSIERRRARACTLRQWLDDPALSGD